MIDFCLLLMDFYEINLEVYVVGGGRSSCVAEPRQLYASRLVDCGC